MYGSGIYLSPMSSISFGYSGNPAFHFLILLSEMEDSRGNLKARVVWSLENCKHGDNDLLFAGIERFFMWWNLWLVHLCGFKI